HESTDTFVALHTSPIIDPDDSKVLHIMKHFEKCYADEDILDAVIAIPPKGNAADQKCHLHRTGDAGGTPISRLSPDEGNGHHNKCNNDTPTHHRYRRCW